MTELELDSLLFEDSLELLAAKKKASVDRCQQMTSKKKARKKERDPNAISRSAPAAIASLNSMTVTFEPRRLQTDPCANRNVRGEKDHACEMKERKTERKKPFQDQ